ncbi:hypothetical protein E2C01_019891 [Portunus trituberculatus]|uniref:Uncharacterized protein n=1 Tax=Portunus trituberculatus TaxID=210409 RepID=A0A5B7E0M6_PORTR|nr:hypothetical protein [Portunus trituberculatus]
MVVVVGRGGKDLSYILAYMVVVLLPCSKNPCDKLSEAEQSPAGVQAYDLTYFISHLNDLITSTMQVSVYLGTKKRRPNIEPKTLILTDMGHWARFASKQAVACTVRGLEQLINNNAY